MASHDQEVSVHYLTGARVCRVRDEAGTIVIEIQTRGETFYFALGSVEDLAGLGKRFTLDAMTLQA